MKQNSFKRRIYSHLDNVPVFGKLFFQFRWKTRLYLEKLQLGRKAIDKVFVDIYQYNRWGNDTTLSGDGSSLPQTTVIRQEFPHILEDYSISSVLDIPCGDFNWMRHVNLSKIEYIGADIVPDLIIRNKQFEKENISFLCIDLTKGPLPKVDLVLVRDCLVHLSFSDIDRAFYNIGISSSKYLLTTTFPNHNKNIDIRSGQWRPINLQLPPFNFPEPDLIIREGNPNPEYRDKSICLWNIDHLRQLFLTDMDNHSSSKIGINENNQTSGSFGSGIAINDVG